MEIPLYQDGLWTKCAHPIADDGSGDYEEWMNNGGYSPATTFHPGGDERAVILEVYADGADPSRPDRRAPAGAPKYLVDVRFHPGETETVAVATIVDLMNLLAKWTPVVQAALACDDSLIRLLKNER